jgi:tetratricopeptide (TPR) repeat protein
MRHALSLAIEQGQGWSAAVLYNNLTAVTWMYDGPQAALDFSREGIEFSQRRGVTEMVESMAGAQTPFLAELGDIEEALTDAARLADLQEQKGDINFVDPRSLQLRLLAERGQHEQAPSPEPLLNAARNSGQPQNLATAVAAAASLLRARGQTKQAYLVLGELDRTAASRVDPFYGSVLPSLVRSALAVKNLDLAASLVEGVPSLTPLHQHALTSCLAQLAEAAGNHQEAASLYSEAAEQWRDFGNVPECAYAALGQGRCLRAIGDPAAEHPLTEARDLFASMGYKPALAETEALLQQAQAAAT